LLYHVTLEADLRAHTHDGCYRPTSLDFEGFVHCAEHASVLPVARDLFELASERVLVLEIDPARLSAPVRFEAPAPLPGAGTRHLEGVAQFPHVYGAIELTAVARVGELRRDAGEGFAWPTHWLSAAGLLAGTRADCED